jgi:starch synthase
MKIAYITSEAFPYVKTGGLADVGGSLPIALNKQGCDVKLFIPKYSVIDELRYKLTYRWDIDEIPIRINGQIHSVHVHQSKLPGSNVDVFFIDCPHYFFRKSIYTNDRDEDERFILFSKAIIELIQKLKWIPDVINCNDWQTGLLPLLLRDKYKWDEKLKKIATVFTIHNIGYQGIFPKSALSNAEVGEDFFYTNGPIEFHGNVSFIKAGIVFSDLVNTVSPTYANEILTQEYGAGLEDILGERQAELYGILNGADYTIWNPENDKLIPFRYSKRYLTGKLKNKKYLLNKLGLEFDESIPLIGIVSRLVEQKGLDILSEIINDLMNPNTQWVILGSGENKYETLFNLLSRQYPEKVAVYIGYNNELSHLIEAASDIFLMPSKYEPCGLNQVYSLKYGTVPVVRRTGGLADTVEDWYDSLHKGNQTGTGFSFNDYSSYALKSTLERAVITFADKTAWKKIQVNGMNKDYSWEFSAKQYISLYEKAIKKILINYDNKNVNL